MHDWDHRDCGETCLWMLPAWVCRQEWEKSMQADYEGKPCDERDEWVMSPGGILIPKGNTHDRA